MAGRARLREPDLRHLMCAVDCVAGGVEVVGYEVGGGDGLLGERPEHWSPLAKVDHSSFGRFSASTLPLRDSVIGNTRALSVEAMEGPSLRFGVDGEPVALLSVALDCFAVAIPAAAVAVTVRVGRDEGLADRSTMVSGSPLPQDRAPEDGFDELIVWRV